MCFDSASIDLKSYIKLIFFFFKLKNSMLKKQEAWPYYLQFWKLTVVPAHTAFVLGQLTNCHQTFLWPYRNWVSRWCFLRVIVQLWICRGFFYSFFLENSDQLKWWLGCQIHTSFATWKRLFCQTRRDITVSLFFFFVFFFWDWGHLYSLV